MNPVYVYGIVRPGVDLSEAGTGDDPVETVTFHNLAAVLTEVSSADMGKVTGDRSIPEESWLETWASRHVDVIRAVFCITDILPLRFNTVYSDRTRVRDMMRTRYDYLSAGLNRVARAEEYGISVYARREAVNRSMKEAFMEAESDGRRLTPGRLYLLERQAEIRVASEDPCRLLAHLLAPAENLKRCSRDHRRLAPDLEQAVRDSRVIYKAAFLVDREQREQFLNAVRQWQECLSDSEFSLGWSGPWPPYSFSSPGEGDVS